MTDEKCPRDELLAALAADGLSPDEERELNAHLETCAVCREARDQNDDVRRVLRALPLPRPREVARERAYGAVLEAMSRGKGSTEVTKSAAAPPARAVAATRRPFRMLVGIAAGVCAVAMASLYVLEPSRQAAFAPEIARAPEADVARREEAGRRALKAQAESAPPLSPPADAPRSPAPEEPTGGKPAPAAAPAPAELGEQNLEAFANAGGKDRRKTPAPDRGDLAMTRRALLSVAHEQVRVDSAAHYLARNSAAGEEELEKELDKSKGGTLKNDAPAPAPPAANDDAKRDEAPRRAQSKPGAAGVPAKKALAEPTEKTEKKPADAETADAKKARAKAEAPADPEPLKQTDFDTEPPGTLVLRVTQRAEGTDVRGFWVEKTGKDEAGANNFAGLSATAAVTSLAVTIDDPAQRDRLLQILDRELAREPHDLLWAKRVLALANAIGADTGVHPAEPSPATEKTGR
jgi:hypothetical protein